MLVPLLMIAAGVGLLLGGGEFLVRGATSIARHWRVAPTVVGLTVVAAGTSAPELVVSMSAALQGTPDLAMGNVVGSNIYNLALILGVSAMIQPLRIQGSTVKLEWPILFLCTCLMHLLGRDGQVDRLEGTFFVAGLITFIAWTVYIAKREVAGEEELAIMNELPDDELTFRMAWVATVGGALMLTLGAQAMVSGAVSIATLMGVSERIVGLTVVALGTSLPELVASVVAAMKKEADIAVANVIGSNLYNTLGILGLTAVVSPVPVNPKTLNVDNPWMIGFTLLLLPLMWRRRLLGRLEGTILLSLLVTYSLVLYFTV